MDIIEIKILALKQLKLDHKETLAYDGYDEEYMLERFISENGYTPSSEFFYLKDEIIEELFKESSKKDFELHFYKLSSIDLLHNIDKFHDFEKEIIQNFNHFPKRVLLSIKSFLMTEVSNLGKIDYL